MNQGLVKYILHTLKKLARGSPELQINELRIILALERLVARLAGHAPLSDHLIFKGGFVLLKQYKSDRFTRDADALAIDIPKPRLKELAQRAIMTDLNDGLWYGNIQVKELNEQGQYGAYRFACAFQIGEPEKHKIHKLPRIHIDIGFSDSLLIQPLSQQMPSLFQEVSPVSWVVYPIEQIVSEKLQTIFQRGAENSRARDVYDLIYLLPRCPDKKGLLSTIYNTFQNRKSKIPSSFYEEAKQITDRTFLQAAWKGLRIFKNKPSFDEAWEMLLQYLRELDQK